MTSTAGKVQKLTEAQAHCLRCVADGKYNTRANSGRTMDALERKGLIRIEWRQTIAGEQGFPVLTDAGRAAL